MRKIEIYENDKEFFLYLEKKYRANMEFYNSCMKPNWVVKYLNIRPFNLVSDKEIKNDIDNIDNFFKDDLNSKPITLYDLSITYSIRKESLEQGHKDLIKMWQEFRK
jgi:hypothetical protein